VSRLPLSVRLALLFSAAMALVLAGAGWLVYERVATDLQHNLDQELRSRAQDVSALVARGGSLRATRGPLIESGESFAETLSANGNVVDATAPVDVRLVSAADLTRALHAPVFSNRDSVPGLDEPARLLAVPLHDAAPARVLVVGTTRENRIETLHSLSTSFLVGGPIALALAGLGAYLLARATLRPIEQMRQRAQEISSSSLQERLPVPAADDEVARLGHTLNAMLARIEDGVARERNFVTDASHELRTPLALLKAELELALRRGRTTDELEDSIRSAAAETDRLGRIANDLLLLARSENGRLPLRVEPLDVGDVLEAVRARFAPAAVESQRDLLVREHGAPIVRGDRLRLEQALGNLVDNALRHGHGTVVLESVTRDGALELHVRDDGDGFDPAYVARAFERFSRGPGARAAEGSGLGLAIAETVADAHDGSARARNREAGGADVWISLPLD
jgi:heavy metal sensor kinase